MTCTTPAIRAGASMPPRAHASTRLWAALTYVLFSRISCGPLDSVSAP